MVTVERPFNILMIVTTNLSQFLVKNYKNILEIHKMTVRERKLTCHRMVTKYRGLKSIEDINRNRKKGMVLCKPGSHDGLKDCGKINLA